MLLGPGFTVENRARVALYDLPARTPPGASPPPSSTAFAPTRPDGEKSQCTYRCVVLPDIGLNIFVSLFTASLNAPTGAWCSLTTFVLSSTRLLPPCLNAPTGAWCSLTPSCLPLRTSLSVSQCTYRCVVLPDFFLGRRILPPRGLNAPTGAWCSLTYEVIVLLTAMLLVSMHLQVRGAP